MLALQADGRYMVPTRQYNGQDGGFPAKIVGSLTNGEKARCYRIEERV